MSRIVLKLLMLAVFIINGAFIGCAQEADVASQPEMAGEQNADQARMMEYSTPNDNHKVLEQLAGKFSTKSKFWMDPKGEPQETEGVAEHTMVMGGRFLEQKYTGTFMGEPYEGRGLIGYDNMRKEYTSIWYDSMSTGIMNGKAQFNAEAKTFAEDGAMSCPVTNETHRKFRGVTKIVDENTHVYETYLNDMDGNEYKAMEITYTRM